MHTFIPFLPPTASIKITATFSITAATILTIQQGMYFWTIEFFNLELYVWNLRNPLNKML